MHKVNQSYDFKNTKLNEFQTIQPKKLGIGERAGG